MEVKVSISPFLFCRTSRRHCSVLQS